MSDLYADGPHYDALFGDRNDDLEFYFQRCRAAKGPVLELACGTGRITLPLAKVWVPITGLDLSAAMLATAAEKAAAVGLELDLVQADIRDFKLGRTFKLIFLPFNSMQHLHDRASLESLFACVRSHLDPGGRFILDVHRPNLALLSRDPGKSYPLEEPGDLDDGTRLLGEEISYDDVGQVVTTRWRYQPPDGSAPRVNELKARMFFPQELDALLHYNGFEILEKYGDFTGGRFEAQSLKQVVVCEAKAAP